MDEQMSKTIKGRFLEWSGGFAPESDYQITVYIDYALSIEDDPEAVRKLLREWMCGNDYNLL